METKHTRQRSIFLLSFGAALALELVLSLVAPMLSRGMYAAMAFGLALCIGLTAYTAYRRGCRKISAALPPPFNALSADQSLEGQIQALSQDYGRKAQELNQINVERFLTRLLEDNSHTHVIENLNDHLQSILRSEQFGYRWSSYCLVYVVLEDYESYMLHSCDGRLLLNDFRRMYDVVQRAFSSVLNQRHYARSVDWKNGCVFLVNLAGTTEDTPQEEKRRMIDQICQLCGVAVRRVRESFDLSIHAVVSTPFQDVTETHTIFDWMQIVREYNDFVSAPLDVLGPNNALHPFDGPARTPPSMERIFYSAILSEDFGKAEQALVELTQYQLSTGAMSIPRLKRMVSAFLGSAEDIATSNHIASGESDIPDWRSELECCDAKEGLYDLIHRFFCHLINRSEVRRSEGTTTARRIIAFLDENFTNPDLSLSMLAEALNLSQSYISRVFKKETGTSVPDYIHEKRIRLAKELLADPSRSIGEVALQVGYSNAWTMNRAFKLKVQMTPGAWRQMLLSNAGEAVTS